eukprot:8672681-Alexandrium_andersonii.AAC.1
MQPATKHRRCPALHWPAAARRAGPPPAQAQPQPLRPPGASAAGAQRAAPQPRATPSRRWPWCGASTAHRGCRSHSATRPSGGVGLSAL